MMNEKEYIATGMLEAYCLGTLDKREENEVLQMCVLYPSVRAELSSIETVLEKMTLSLAVEPRLDIREKIINTVFNPLPLNVDALPLTDATSDLDAWLKALAHLIPDEHDTDFYMRLLREDKLVTQALVISKVNIPDETHDNLLESFFILEGSCKCVVGDMEYILHAGDFLEIPLHQPHNVDLLTPYVVAIHQQLAVV